MEKRRPIYIEKLLDPFTVLKMCQLLREIPPGKSLKLQVKGESLPEELARILAPDHYQVTVEQSTKNPLFLDVVIKKRELPGPETNPTTRKGGGCCR